MENSGAGYTTPEFGMQICMRRRCYNQAMRIESLPGHELIQAGIEDLSRGIESIATLLVSVGAPRLRRLGVAVPDRVLSSPEQRLYEMLCREDPDAAHSRHNALMRRLVSFERAAECES